MRIDARWPVAYRLLAPYEPPAASTKDIGGGGVRLAVHEPLKVHTPLAVELTVPWQVLPIRFIGEVMWTEATPAKAGQAPSHEFEAGLQFLKIDPKDQQALVQYIMRGNPPPSPA